MGLSPQVSDWVDECNAKHSCSNFTEAQSFPTRLLKIVKTGTGKPQVSLVHSAGQKGQYACLSHCWGGHLPIRTMRATLDTFTDGISWNDIPLTYRDAMQLTEKLGLEYIWIDSLCIVQDDPDDWAREAASMADVYANCYITIAAVSSANCAEGFKIPAELSVSGSTSAGQPYRVFAEPRDVDRYHPFPPILTALKIEVAWPLLSRGWVLQERLLSPRVLYITQFEMIWECRGRICCQCDDPARNQRMSEGLKDFTLLKDTSASGWLLTDTERLSSDSTKNWHNLIERYTEMHLSVPADKLPAISGVAKRIAAQRPRTSYIAGLWRDTLAIDLLWVRQSGRSWALQSQSQEMRLARMALQDRAPSWSWACRDNTIVFPFSAIFYTNGETPSAGVVRHLWFEIKQVECDQATADPTGSVLPGARLTLRGPVLDVELVNPTPNARYQTNDGYKVLMRSGPKKGLEAMSAPASQSIFFDNSDAPLEKPFVSGDPENNISCLKMALVDRYSSGVSGNVTVEYAMLLRRVGDGVYRRIGMIAYNQPISKDGEHQVRSAFVDHGEMLEIRVL